MHLQEATPRLAGCRKRAASRRADAAGAVTRAVSGETGNIVGTRVYGTPRSDAVGVCHAPGAPAGLGPLHLDVGGGLCTGTDGLHAYGGTGLGCALTGIGLQVWRPKHRSL